MIKNKIDRYKRTYVVSTDEEGGCGGRSNDNTGFLIQAPIMVGNYWFKQN